ncbi:unnamed protein product, partial [Symbiodinium necroappetens]
EGGASIGFGALQDVAGDKDSAGDKEAPEQEDSSSKSRKKKKRKSKKAPVQEDGSSDSDEKKKKRKNFDVETAVLGARTMLVQQLSKVHSELLEARGGAEEQLELWNQQHEELTKSVPLSDLLLRRVEAIDAVCGGAATDIPKLHDVLSDPTWVATHTAAEKAFKGQQKQWEDAGTAEPYAGYFANGPLLTCFMSLKHLPSGLTCKKDLEQKVKMMKGSIKSHGELVKRTNAIVQRALKAQKDFTAAQEKKESQAQEQALKQE